jgi:hypothetical protein
LGLGALKKFLGCCCAVALLAALTASRADDSAAHRVEARSTNLLVVGIVQGDWMSIHLSRLLDNAPVRDAVVTVLIRGVRHPTVAEADGSYTLRSADLTVPGSAVVEFQVAQRQMQEVLTGTLQLAGESREPEEKNGARQLGWWMLNFAVCIGFLVLWSRRRKAAAKD